MLICFQYNKYEDQENMQNQAIKYFNNENKFKCFINIFI